jgi:transcriptional regulator with GAF, ATPase, and Fis domain
VSTVSNARMSALSFLYENMCDFPVWFRRLTPAQVEDVVDVMVAWHLPAESYRILPLREIEQREMLRALAATGGNVIKAAKAVGMGKTTFYRKLKNLGCTPQDWKIRAQASALMGEQRTTRF